MLPPFLTGTKAYGPVNADSDTDIVVLDSDYQTIKGILELALIGYKGGKYGDLKFNISEGHSLNIIFVTPEEYFEWKYATKRLQELKPIEDKVERYERFEKERETVRNLLEVCEMPFSE